MVPGGGDSMVPGGTEISLNCYNSINICHSEERFSVLESPSHALSDDIFGDIYHILTFFFTLKMIKHLSKAMCKVWQENV